MMLEEYLVVEGRINKEKENLLALEKELRDYGLYPTITARAIGGFSLEDAAAIRIIGSILHDYYTAIENILRTVASRIDKSIPTGEQWHRELLEQMTLAIPGVRPQVLSTETARELNEYRGFRHIFRNLYGFTLSSRRVADLLSRLPAINEALQRDLDIFQQKMREFYGIGEGRA
ncbi:MAG: hypothetical protein HPY52_07070 [Firmicutes bacterium]|nr:hypothetical protein [Bacillota bacterium]